MSNATKLLYMDIETEPLLSWTWGTWQQDVIRVEKEWGILCFAYSWDGGPVKVVARPDFPDHYAKDPDSDLKVCEVLWGLLDEAQIACGHNIDQFDLPKSRARFAANGLAPHSPVQTIDTLKIAKRMFKFTSNRLGEIGPLLGLGEKKDTGGFQLWIDVMRGDEKAWRKMKSYCAQDVRLLIAVLEALRPWMETGLPSMSILTGDLDACPKCGEKPLTKQGFKYTKVSKFQQWRCVTNGCWSRSRLAERDEKPQLV